MTLVDAAEPRGPRLWLTGLGIQMRVLYALIVRDLMTRYGRGNIGFLWLALEPMILCVGVVALRWAIQEHHEHGISLVAMLLSGYMPLTLWRHLSGKSVFLFRRNASMLFHRRVSLMDLFITTAALEFVGCTIAFAVNYGAFVVLGVLDPIADYGMVAAGWITLAILSISAGASIAVLTEKYEASERFIAPMQYLLLPISGFLFMVDWLPDSVQRLAWWMPLIHCFEMVRAGFFGDAVTTHFTPAYPLVFALILAAISIPQFESTREHLQV